MRSCLLSSALRSCLLSSVLRSWLFHLFWWSWLCHLFWWSLPSVISAIVDFSVISVLEIVALCNLCICPFLCDLCDLWSLPLWLSQWCHLCNLSSSEWEIPGRLGPGFRSSPNQDREFWPEPTLARSSSTLPLSNLPFILTFFCDTAGDAHVFTCLLLILLLILILILRSRSSKFEIQISKKIRSPKSLRSGYL